MKLVAELSLYPLTEQYIGPIKDFIARLNGHPELEVVTTATSTRVAGSYKAVMAILSAEMQRTHEQVGQAVFVCKFLNGDKMQEHAS
ncbi:hypothetical protein HMF8227_02053 [Saliniradius amylolyticus]|uniref:Thiamin/hydroxymethyl pyrimidine-binding YkoF putative domain-containing protein n=1 Tax=Saliniradius amylolyticus TaxID=2183582 RepID=A0A2S2E6C5_9ALTE|nr:YkoF family thiamine/hydroxymethylpyrimidine-binding protein [Saliniradius amylolyticus]AWL12517.1 hypothetical protein HMF8227_02053 [Saliniradius amylolyticus]